MAVTLKGRDFVSLHDFTVEEIEQIFDTARFVKMMDKTGQPFQPLKGKTLGMIFTKPSTRTRISFEVAMFELGGHALFLSSQDLQLRRGETVADTARVLSRYVDGIMIRTFSHDDVLELAKYAAVPVINGLTDLLHPCQAAADVFTIIEKKGTARGVKLAYLGDGNNVAHSLMFAGAKTGMHVVVCSPPGYEPNPEIVRLAREDARATGAVIELASDPREAVRGADVVYTDVWVSMGQEAERDERVKALTPYQINEDILKLAKPDAIFEHCLPAHRGEEVTDGVMDGVHSVVFDEAENRLHVQKAILALTL
ncbi:MAG: ornithine carbamoyltransferase [Firmicutes bacterium]|nr:ornithine carbamoyltransferase [Bacillota bacterium]